MTKNNALPPASQPWVRELEKRIKDLENKSYRTDSKVNVMSNRVMSPKVDLDALSVTEIRVGGDEPQVFEHEVQNYSINGNTITASTPPVPVQRGFIMEWEVDVTASVDYIQVSSSLDPEMYEDPEEPTGALAGEETTYFADASYMTEDVEVGEDEDEMFNPVPPIVSFTLHNPANTAFTFTVHAVRMRFIIPGEGGLRITQGGEIYIEDGAGHDRIIQEISEEQAQAIIETADNLKQAQQDLEAARTEAEQNFGILDDKLGEAFPENIFDVDLAIEQAKQLAEQQFNDSITGSLVEYARNSNETNPPITGWSTTAPTRTPGTFIWMRTTISYGSGDTSTTDPVLLTGNDGPQGQALYTWIKYAPNGNPTTAEMSESPVGMTYMGIAHNQTTQAEGTDPTAYSWSLIKGPQGDTGVRGPDGKDGQSLYTWVKYAPNGSPTASQITDTPQATSTHIGLAYNKTTASESTVPGDYTWSLIKGPKGDKGEKGDTGADGLPGDAGKGIKSTDISYARSTSGSTAPSTGWQEQPPSPIKGQYLWTRTIWTYTDDATETGYSSAYWAQDGAKGNDGAAGKDGTKLTGTVNEYAQSTSGTTPPTSGWATQPPTAVPGRYMWTRSTWTYSDGTTEQGYTVGKIGDTGPKGDRGLPGDKGADGTQFYTWLKYAPNGNPTSAQMTDVPNSNSTHMGIALNQTSPTEGTNPSSYTWSLIKGTDGVKGDPGADGKSLYTWIKYAPNGSPTNAQMTDLPQSNSTHIGLAYNKTTATESTAASAYTWTLIQGPKGDKGVEGDQGVSVSSITPHFRRLADSAGKPAKPSGMTPSGWVDVEPDYARDTTMWRSDRIVFSNGQITWTDVSKLSSYEAAKAAESAALAYADARKDEAINAAANTAQVKADIAKQAAIDASLPKIFSKTATSKTFRDLANFSYRATGEGAIVIRTPITPSTKMCAIKITGYNFRSEKSEINLMVNFYAYTPTTPFHTPTYTSSGNFVAKVQGGVNATTGDLELILTPPAGLSTWSYPDVSVPEATISFNMAPDSWAEGWDISMVPLSEIAVGERYSTLVNFPMAGPQAVADAAIADASTAVQRANAAVKDTKIEYAVNTSETTPPTSGWSTSTPTRSPGSYVWMRTTVTYGDGTPSVLAPVLVTGNDGAKGATGSKGADGSVITSSVVEYAQSTSGTTKPTSWSTTVPSPVEGRYIWTRTTFKYTVGPDQYSYSVGKIGEKGSNGAPGGKGDKGDPGTPGVSVSSITPFFLKSASKPSQPSGTGTPSGWTTTEPAYTTGTKLWRSERVLYSNSTAQWTPVTEVATYTGIDAAMTMASGKNAVSYTTFGSSSIEPPGTAPTTSMGSGRRVYDMHRNRLTDGTIIGEWMWTGSAWTQLELSDAMLSSLDVGKLTAGTANIETGVINKLWGQLGVFDKLDVRTDAYVSGVHLKDGAVTAEALNVAHVDPVTGYAWRAEPEGLTFLDENGNPTIVLRTDMANYFTIMREGTVVASISPHGDITGRSVSAAESLRYKGEELSALLEIPARGVLARSTNFGNAIAIVGTSAARVAAVSLTTPATNRNIEIKFEGRLSQGTAERRILFNVRQSANPYVRPTNTSVKDWYVTAKGNDEIVLSFTTTTEELEWPYGTPITLGVFAESVSGETLTFHQSGRQQLIVKDLGPAVTPQSHKPYVPSSGGGTPIGTMDERLWREQVSRKEASWVQTYKSDGTKYVRMNNGSDSAQRWAYQGYTDATSGVIGFPSMVTELSGATIKRVRLWITNTATHRPEGATARISLHGYAAKPATHSWSTDVPIMEVPFIRGETQVIDIPTQYHAGVKSGLYRGVVLSASELGTQYVGGWDGENALWEIIYEK